MSYHQQKPFNRDQHRGKDSSKSTALTLVNVLSDISFCDKQCSNVNDNTVKNNIILPERKAKAQKISQNKMIIKRTTIPKIIIKQVTKKKTA
jgi:hypothetical protein